MRRWFSSMKIRLRHKLRRPVIIKKATAIVRVMSNVKRIYLRSA